MQKTTLLIIILILIPFHRDNTILHVNISRTPDGDVHLQLSRLINSEGGGESFLGQIAIGYTAQNIAKHRVKSLYNVITSKKIFDGIGTKKYTEIPSPMCYIAALVVLYDTNNDFPKNILYYYNPNVANDIKWISVIQNSAYMRIGKHVFCINPTT